MLFENTWLNGDRVDLRVVGGKVQALRVVVPSTRRTADPPLVPKHGEEIVRDGMVLPHFAEPHVHLDATQLGVRRANLPGTLREGIRIWSELRGGLTFADVRHRALKTIRWYLHHGVTRIRTHVDTACLPAVEALVALRQELLEGIPEVVARPVDGGRELKVPIELQIVAFPQEGILRERGQKERWAQVAAMGVNAIGAIPHFERTQEEGWRSVKMTFELAERLGLPIDIHCDETDDDTSRNLEVVCAEAIDRNMGARVVVGHCTALHSYNNPLAAKVIELCARAGLMVVTNPLDNIVLQGRYDRYPRRRGITRVDELWAAGVRVGIGHDSVVDPWYRLGTANLLDPAWMLLHVGHLTSQEQMARIVTTLHRENHQIFGDVAPLVENGPATFQWYPCDDPIELLRTRPKPRVFFRGAEVSVPVDGETGVR